MKKIIFFIVCFIVFTCVKAENIYTNAYVALNEAYMEYSGACSNEEKLAIIEYAGGKLDRLSAGYDVIINLKTRSLKPMSFECANNTEGLYREIVNANKLIVNADVNVDTMTLVSNVEQITNILVVGSKLKSEEGLTILDDCNLINDKMMKKTNEYFRYFQIGAISIGILLCILDVFKILLNGKVESKKIFKIFTKRIIAIVVLLLIPIIVSMFISLVNNYISVDAIKCLES